MKSIYEYQIDAALKQKSAALYWVEHYEAMPSLTDGQRVALAAYRREADTLPAGVSARQEQDDGAGAHRTRTSRAQGGDTMNKDVIEQERQRSIGLGVTDSRRFVPFWDERRQRKAMPSEATEALKQNANERMEKRIGEMHEYAKRFYRSQGNFPTITDFMKVLSIASKNTVSYHLSEMESRGLIVRIGGKGTTGRYTLPEVLEALKSL